MTLNERNPVNPNKAKCNVVTQNRHSHQIGQGRGVDEANERASPTLQGFLEAAQMHKSGQEQRVKVDVAMVGFCLVGLADSDASLVVRSL